MFSNTHPSSLRPKWGTITAMQIRHIVTFNNGILQRWFRICSPSKNRQVEALARLWRRQCKKGFWQRYCKSVGAVTTWPFPGGTVRTFVPERHNGQLLQHNAGYCYSFILPTEWRGPLCGAGRFLEGPKESVNLPRYRLRLEIIDSSWAVNMPYCAGRYAPKKPSDHERGIKSYLLVVKP